MLTFIYNRLGVIVDLLRQILAKQTAVETRLTAVEKGQTATKEQLEHVAVHFMSFSAIVVPLVDSIANDMDTLTAQVAEIHAEVVPGPAVTIELIGSDPEEQP
jgi:hypothetical protein